MGMVLNLFPIAVIIWRRASVRGDRIGIPKVGRATRLDWPGYRSGYFPLLQEIFSFPSPRCSNSLIIISLCFSCPRPSFDSVHYAVSFQSIVSCCCGFVVAPRYFILAATSGPGRSLPVVFAYSPSNETRPRSSALGHPPTTRPTGQTTREALEATRSIVTKRKGSAISESSCLLGAPRTVIRPGHQLTPSPTSRLFKNTQPLNDASPYHQPHLAAVHEIRSIYWPDISNARNDVNKQTSLCSPLFCLCPHVHCRQLRPTSVQKHEHHSGVLLDAY